MSRGQAAVVAGLIASIPALVVAGTLGGLALGIASVFLLMACVLYGDCLAMVGDAAATIAEYGSAAAGAAAWGADQLSQAVANHPLLPNASTPTLLLFGLGISFAGLDTVYDGLALASGHDPFTGEALSPAQMGLFSLALVLPFISGHELSLATEAISEPSEEIWLMGFRGAGKKGEHYIAEEPLTYAGHVGISFDQGKTIYGFTPYAPGVPFVDLMQQLKDHVTFPGVVGDDTMVFQRAQDLFEQGMERTQVYKWSQSVTKEEAESIRQSMLGEMASSPMDSKRYGFPDGPEICYNCATWPGTIGIQIPELSGNLRYYIPKLIEMGEPWLR